MTPHSVVGSLLGMSAAVLLVACSGGSGGGDASSVGGSATPSASTSSGTTAPPDSGPPEVTDIARDLDVPWDIAFLPDGDALVTLRDRGTIVRIADGRVSEVGTVPGVAADGEGGLLGLAVSPDFAQDETIFVYTTTDEDNRVVRMTFGDNGLGSPEPVLTGIPNAGVHNGGRIAFGPDGHLYVATGDAGETSSSQRADSLGGKILRITPDGEPAPGNPFSTSPVWSWGHRNVQGLAWAADGRMLASELGQDTWDELNVVEGGANYGWPVVSEGDHYDGKVIPPHSDRPEFAAPAISWNPVIAPGDFIIYSGDKFPAWKGQAIIGGMKPTVLVRVAFDGDKAREVERIPMERRIREVVQAPDGAILLLEDKAGGRLLRLTPR